MTTKSLDDDEQERWGLPYLRLGYLGVRCPEVQHCRLLLLEVSDWNINETEFMCNIADNCV